MPLAPGQKLGPYEILAPIGAGGMGEVYKATDTRLGRTVAVKVLPEAAAGRAELRERLSREAKAISSLSHPNICALHDVGHQDGIDYLVMEYLEGETLASRLQSGPLPLPEVLSVATQIAHALAAAHKRGLIHRDLKPGNVMITASGAKLLDFGLAKGFDAAAPGSSLTAAPTATSPLTAQGTIVGTYQYMAPEQLEGSAADARSDIFAFGAVLYEMATGRRPFEGKTQASLIASIMKETPRALSELAPMSPPGLQRLVATCMEKDPEARRQTMNDVLLDLRWIAEGGSQAGVPASVSRRRRRQDLALIVVTVAAIAAAIVFATLWRRSASVPERPVVTSVLMPADVRSFPDDGFALSPDGESVVFSGSREGSGRSLWLRRLDSSSAAPIAGTDNARCPFWSPDGRSLAFFADAKLKRVDVAGGPTQALAPAPEGRGGTWNDSGTIVYSPDYRDPLSSLPSTGGEPKILTELDDERGETSHRWPWFLPDGRHVLFLSQTAEGGTTDDRSRIEVLDLETLERRPLFAANSSIAYSETGHILFWSQGAVYAQPFDPASLETTGSFRQIAGPVRYTGNEMGEFSVDRRGKLAFQEGEGFAGFSRFTWIDREGNVGEEISGAAEAVSPRISPDGKSVTYGMNDDIWVRDLERGAARRLTFEGNDDFSPAWSPDSQWVAFVSSRGRDAVVLRKRASGLGGEEPILTIPKLQANLSDWSRDGKRLLLEVRSDETDWDVMELPAEGGQLSTLVQTPRVEMSGRYSPDGEWFAYWSNESALGQIYVVRIPPPGGRWQISTQGGRFPAWRADGKELFFLEPEDSLMSVDVTLADSFEAGIPKLLFHAPFRRGDLYPYDPAPDGRRFIANLRKDEADIRPLTLIQNWSAALAGN